MRVSLVLAIGRTTPYAKRFWLMRRHNCAMRGGCESIRENSISVDDTTRGTSTVSPLLRSHVGLQAPKLRT